jgi:hypothetical protein
MLGLHRRRIAAQAPRHPWRRFAALVAPLLLLLAGGFAQAQAKLLTADVNCPQNTNNNAITDVFADATVDDTLRFRLDATTCYLMKPIAEGGVGAENVRISIKSLPQRQYPNGSPTWTWFAFTSATDIDKSPEGAASRTTLTTSEGGNPFPGDIHLRYHRPVENTETWNFEIETCTATRGSGPSRTTGPCQDSSERDRKNNWSSVYTPSLNFRYSGVASGVPVTLEVFADTPQLQNIPFNLTVGLFDQFGNATISDTDISFTLTASGGVLSPSDLRYPLGDDRETGAPGSTRPFGTIPAGTHSLLIENVVFTGVSDPDKAPQTTPDNDDELYITLRARDNGARISDGTRRIVVRDTVLSISASDFVTVYLDDDYIGQTLVTATLTDAQGVGLPNQTVHFSITGPNGDLSTPTSTTDADGRTSVILYNHASGSSIFRGDIEVTARCPGACPQATTVRFASVPIAPVITSTTALNSTLLIDYLMPTDGGADPITSCSISADGGRTWTVLSQMGTAPAFFTGLQNGTEYDMRIRCSNRAGHGAHARQIATPVTVPTAPTLTGIVAGDTFLLVSYSLPIETGGDPITSCSYRYRAGGAWSAWTSTPLPEPTVDDQGDEIPGVATFEISGLTNGIDHSIEVRCSNPVAGPGPAVAGNGTPVGALSAPTNLQTSSGNARGWIVGFNRVEGASGYEYRLDGGAWITLPTPLSFPFLISPLNNGQVYAVEVRAFNADGFTDPVGPSFIGPNEEVSQPPLAAIEAEPTEERTTAAVEPDGKAILKFDFTLTNTGGTTLREIYLRPAGLPDGSTVIDLEPRVGIIARLNDGRWYWSGLNIPPEGTATVRVTVEIEVEP